MHKNQCTQIIFLLSPASSEFCQISGDWGKLEIPNLAQMSLMKCYRMLQNTKVTGSTVSELLRENQQIRVNIEIIDN